MRTQFLPSGVMALKTQISFDLDGVLQQNPFRLGVFPHVCRALAPFIGAEEPEPETAVRRLILGEAKRRLLDGRHVEAYDWDDIVARVANALGAAAPAPRPGQPRHRGAGAPLLRGSWHDTPPARGLRGALRPEGTRAPFDRHIEWIP